jgi:molecular chaperone HscB
VDADPFAALGIEPSFDLDLELLNQRHRELSKALHPDRFAGGSGGERRQAIERAIAVNEAFRKLNDPVSRGEELLRRLGVDLSEATEPAADPQLLFEMMEAREELAALRRSADLPSIEKLAARIKERREGVVSTLQEQFAALPNDSSKLTPSKLDSLRQRLGELRYYRRFFEEIRAIEDELS